MRLKPFDTESRIAHTIQACEHAHANDWPYVCAVSLSDLLAAEECGLVEPGLRGRLDVEGLTSYVLSTKGRVEKHWDDELRQLGRIVRHGKSLEYEEVVLVMTLRSCLESACRFLPADRRRQLRDEIDELLDQILRKNQAIVTKLQRRGSYWVDSSLPERWWWQAGLPREES